MVKYIDISHLVFILYCNGSKSIDMHICIRDKLMGNGMHDYISICTAINNQLYEQTFHTIDATDVVYLTLSGTNLTLSGTNLITSMKLRANIANLIMYPYIILKDLKKEAYELEIEVPFIEKSLYVKRLH